MPGPSPKSIITTSHTSHAWSTTTRMTNAAIIVPPSASPRSVRATHTSYSATATRWRATCAFSTVARTVRCLTCRSTAASKCNRPLIMPTTATTTLIQAMTAISADATTSTIWSLKPPNPMCHKTAFRRASTPTVMECRISAIDVPTRKTPSIPTTRVHQRRRRRQDNQLMRRQRNHQQPECRLARLGVASLAKSSAPTARLAMSVRSFHRRCSCLARVCPAVRVPRSMARQSLARLKRLLRLQVRPALRQQVQRLVRHLAT
jgi:hypothetical protein